MLQVFVPCALKQTGSLVKEPSTTYESLHTSAGKVKPNTSWFLYIQYQLQILAATVIQDVQENGLLEAEKYPNNRFPEMRAEQLCLMCSL